MNRIAELIAHLCPDGVEYKPLGHFSRYSETRISADELDATTFVGVDNLLANKAGKTDANYTPNTARLTAYEAGDILLGNIRPYLKKVWLADNSGGCSGDVLAIRLTKKYRSHFLPEFLYYLLSSDDFFAYNMQHAKGAKMPRGNKLAILKYPIPVPPLEVQREIVQVLDAFTALEAELEAELEARRRQYGYYRDRLLAFNGRADIRWATLGEIGTWYGGGTPSKDRLDYWQNGTIPWVSPKDMGRPIIDTTQDFITEAAVKGSATKLLPANSVAVVVRSSILNHTFPTALIPISVALNQDMKAVITHDWILPGYIAHILSSNGPAILRVARKTGGSVASIESNKLFSFTIPIPPLEEQARIVAILDKFDALVNDLTSGLPAEINSRRQQYEHYRDRLLTFPEAKR